MAVVGISFGSATSGDGFNVSATVASIVTNLQTVETPWKTQLTALKADNTALTSIGTDLSSLSTALNNLTNFQGVLASKEGSSSDNNVLTLTNAAATASAGNHTIIVSQLAQTSSDFSDSITSTDKISGALTIQVGSGKAYTVPAISGTSDTLTTYAAAINYADVGVTASVVSDADGTRLSLVSKTSGAAGAITVTQGGTTTTSTATTTAAASVAPTSTVAATNTFSFSSPACELSGTFSYSVGGATAKTIDLGSTPLSLTAAAAALNDPTTGFGAASGLVASVSGSNLIITGATDSTGKATINTSASKLTTTTPSATYGAVTDTTSPIATTTASTSTIAAVNTFTLPSSTAMLSGTFSYSVGGATAKTVDLGSTPLSLTDAASALNTAFTSSGAGLTASVSGSKLIITGQTGASGSANIDTTGSKLSATLNINTGLTAQNATLSVDGVTFNSASNTVSTAIPGVTFQLLSKSTNPVTVTIVNNNTSVETAFTTFVSSYNAVLTDLTTQEGNDASGNAEPLYGSTIIAQLQSALSSALTTGAASGKVNNLAQLGITVGGTGKLALLTLDASALDSTLNTNFSDVVGFFQNSGSFGKSLATTINNMGTASSYGSIALAIASNSKQETNLTAEISAQETLISIQSASLTTELNTANDVLQAIPQKLTEMSELYSALTGYNTKS